MADNITVSIKVRPLIRREKDNKLTSQWRIRENTIANVDANNVEPFVFDNIFDETVPTRQLFDKVCRPIVLSVLNGINGTIFAYGQTSSGKTYTMMGDEEEPGVVPLAAREVFKQIEHNKARQFLIRVGYIEIYNEKIYDLLDKSNANLKIFENTCGDVSLNYKEVITNCPEQVMQHLEEGNKLKRIGDTNMNERSSRSHTIFRITIESRDIAQTQDDEKSAVQISTLNLVDLAGSERADQTGATGSRLKEGAHINKSLLSLSCVIQKLSENADNLKYINYRDSKLTRILQASLGGNAVTSMICNITPAAFDESYYTLCFAMRAKTIKNKPKVNEVLSEAAMMKRLEREIKRLQDELRSEQNKNSKIKTLELQNAITMRANQIINSQTHIQFDKSRRRTWAPSGSAIPKPISLVEQDSYLMPPPPAFLRTVIDTPSSTTSGDDQSSPVVVRPELSNLHHVDLLARKVRSTTPSRQTLPLPFSVGLPLVAPPGPASSSSSLSPLNHSDEFIPGELADFGERSPYSIARDIHTPCALKAKRRSRRSSTGDSPANFIDYEKRCRELEQELRELQEFTNLEKNLDLADIKQQLSSRGNNNNNDHRDDLQCNQERVDGLEERCKDLELELKQKREQVFDVERELIVARKERETAVKEAQQCRNQQESVQVEYEIFQARAKAREKELVECLQEARGDGSSNGRALKDGDSHQKQLDSTRKELKQLEVHNYELQVQLETCTAELEQLKQAGKDHAEKLEKIKSVLDRDIARKDAKKLFRAITSLRAILTEEDLLINTSDPEVLVDSSLNDSADSACQTRIVLTNDNGHSDVIHETIAMDNEELKKKLHQAEQECAELSKRIEECSKQRELEHSKVGQLSKTLQEVEKEKQKLTVEYDELSTQVMDNIQDIDNYKNLVVDLEKKLESASLEKQDLTSSLEQQMESLKKSGEEMLLLRKELEEAKQAHDDELASKLEDLEKLRTELQAEVDSSKQLKNEMNQKQLELENAEKVVKQLQDENHDFMTTIQKHAQDIDELEQAVKEKDQQIQLLKQSLDDLEALKNACSQLSAKNEQLEASKVYHEDKINMLQKENSEITECNKLAQQQLDQLCAEAEKHEQSEEVALKLRQVQEELNSAKSEGEILKQEINSIQEELQSSRDKCDSLCNDLSRVTNENEQLRQQTKESTEVKYMNGDHSEKNEDELEQNTCSECFRLQELVTAKEEAIKQAKEHSNEILRQINTERKDFQERLSEVSEKLLAAEQQRNQSEEQVTQLVGIQTELKNDINNLMQTKEAAESEMSVLKRRVEEFEGMLVENEKEKNKQMELGLWPLTGLCLNACPAGGRRGREAARALPVRAAAVIDKQPIQNWHG